ncbi:MAG: winged helix-turn-helix transcriptional regulator [Candidatus Omnitrophota bacterium]
MQISEKEYAVIQELFNNHSPSQRTIAKNTGISLGMANIIIKRLVKTGYIKISGLNKGKIQYLLTAKGFAEKAAKTYNYTLRTVESLRIIKKKIQEVILYAYRKGVRNFFTQGKNELADIVEIAIRDLGLVDIAFMQVNLHETQTLKGMLIITAENHINPEQNKNYNLQLVNILEILSQ